MRTRKALAKARTRVTGAYHRTLGAAVQRKRSKAYLAREQAKGRPVLALARPAPGRSEFASRGVRTRTPGVPRSSARSGGRSGR